MEKRNTVTVLEEAISKIENKKSKIFFFVFDTKGAPNGELSYIYEMAYKVRQLGYDAQILYSEKDDFVGVGSWLGEKYSNLPHSNIEKDAVSISSCDILLIPDICVQVMSKTKDLPCKRVMILENSSYLMEMMPAGVNLDDLKIREVVAASDNLEKFVKDNFNDVMVHVVKPCIDDVFYMDLDKPKKLIINVVIKNATDADSILKPFYWKYPNYAWVTFRNIGNNLTREENAEALKEGFATIWADPNTDIGTSALEAMACGNVVIGKIPENMPEWMCDKDGNLLDNGAWFFNSSNAQDLIASVIQSFLKESIPNSFYDEMNKTVSNYTSEKQEEQIKSAFIDGLLVERKKELSATKEYAEKISENNEDTNETE